MAGGIPLAQDSHARGCPQPAWVMWWLARISLHLDGGHLAPAVQRDVLSCAESC